MPFTNKQLITLSSAIETCFHICNKPDKSNNIEIKNNVISLILNDSIIFQKELDVISLKEKLQKISYHKNIFQQKDSPFNPLEADRKENKIVWRKDYKGIDFPKFIPIILFSLLIIGEIPSIIDFCKIYMLSYIEPVPKNELISNRLSLYDESFIKHKNDRERIDQIIYYNESTLSYQIKNSLIRFKPKYLSYIHNLPINEFSTEHLCSRIYKMYGSIVRDIYNPLYFSLFNIDSYYSLYYDLSGIDLFLNNIPVYAYTDTSSGHEFRAKKISQRHPELKSNFCIILEKNIHNNISSEKTNGLYLINEDVANNIINVVQEYKNKELDKFIKISF